VVSAWGASVKRLTPVVRYTNYQLTTLRGHGANWALVGDAFGFIDPVFSSGLLVGLDGARALAGAIVRGTPRAWTRWERRVIDHLRAWRRVVDSYYDGRLFTLFKVGNMVQHTPVGGLMNSHFQRHMPRIFTGEATTHRYSRSLLRFMCRYGLAGNDPSRLEVG
jgi:flavin-dependent dehydrogenase